MLREKIIKKILTTTIIFFVILVISTFTITEGISNNKVSYKKDLVNIYLLDKHDYLTEVMILVEDKKDINVVYDIIDNLKNKNYLYRQLKGIIPNNTKINKMSFDNGILSLDFNEELLNVNSYLEEKVIESLIYSLTNIENVKGIRISINGKELDALPKSNIILTNTLTRDFGINKEYSINRTNDILKVVLYYYQEIDNNNYYVPVTKYINNKNDKIKVIIDNLKNSYLYKTNLMSYLTDRIEVLEYERINDIVTLSFNKLITLDSNDAIEEVTYTISSSIFSSTDISKVIFMENDEIIKICLK